MVHDADMDDWDPWEIGVPPTKVPHHMEWQQWKQVRSGQCNAHIYSFRGNLCRNCIQS